MKKEPKFYITLSDAEQIIELVLSATYPKWDKRKSTAFSNLSRKVGEVQMKVLREKFKENSENVQSSN